MNTVIASLDENVVYQAALSQVTVAVEANRTLIESKVTEAVKEQVTANVTANIQAAVTEQLTALARETVAAQVIPAVTNGQMTKETYDASVAAGTIDTDTQTAIESAIDKQMSTDSVKQTIKQNVSAQMETETVKQTISETVDEQMQTETIKNTIAEKSVLQINQAISENMASNDVQNQLQTASEGLRSLLSLKASLDSYNAFYLGLFSYTNGVADAAVGADKIKSGTDDLKSGTSVLCYGVNELYNRVLLLKNGAPTLIEGVTELRDGSMKLSDGLKEFNEKGVSRLVDAVDGDLGGLVTRLRATIDVSKNYKSFSGLSDDMDGKVKFIYRTESVKSDK